MDEYGVLCGYEDGLEESDEEGSRAIPSRTSSGSRAAFIKEYPEYGKTRRFFFGLITEKFWGYRCELTLPEIEIMMADLPHTLYKDKLKKKEDKEDYDNMARLQEEANRKARERREKTLEELFQE